MLDKIPVKFTKMTSEAVTPSHGRFGDAGYDLSSLEDVILEPFERKLIKTGDRVAARICSARDPAKRKCDQ